MRIENADGSASSWWFDAAGNLVSIIDVGMEGYLTPRDE